MHTGIMIVRLFARPEGASVLETPGLSVVISSGMTAGVSSVLAAGVVLLPSVPPIKR